MPSNQTSEEGGFPDPLRALTVRSTGLPARRVSLRSRRTGLQARRVVVWPALGGAALPFWLCELVRLPVALAAGQTAPGWPALHHPTPCTHGYSRSSRFLALAV